MRRLVGVILALATAAACSGGSGAAGSNVCSKAIAKVDSCGFHNLAKTQCEEPDDPDDECTTNCALNLPCSAFVAAYCHGDYSGFLACADQCEPPDFVCASGEEVPMSYKCDGYDDCTDGSDEQGCVFADCGDGSSYTPSDKCDGFTNCANGGDEAGCPGSIACSDGTTAGESDRCDTFTDCPEGEDEAGCTFLTCGDGEQYTVDDKCDGYPNCSDESDELGCGSGGGGNSAEQAVALDCQSLP